ncbi:hypothetical protein GF324_13190 [bacterium]|nr:hypothetical protein [bacterium]
MKRWIQWVLPSSGAALILLTIVMLQGSGPAHPHGEFGEIDSVRMNLDLDPDTHKLTAEAEVHYLPGRSDTLWFLLHGNLELDATAWNGKSISVPEAIARGEKVKTTLEVMKCGKGLDGDHLALYALPLPMDVASDDTPSHVTLSYAGEIHDEVDVASFSRWSIADETTGLIDTKGAFLVPSTGYYPVVPGKSRTARFRSTITVPNDWKALAEGAVVEEKGNTVRFDSEHPIDGSHIVAGPYKLSKKKVDGIEVAMYYYEGSEDLVDRYLDFSGRYLQMYNDMIGLYAYSRFSVVENWFPTGYGMPSYTLLGSRVLRLPFIVHTSLGHEIAHNWWGNGVFVDYDSGNWCEGLTVYCADYYYKALQSEDEAARYRMETLRDYSEYVVRGDEEDFPLREFTSRTTAGTRTIGYGKAMMVFHMVQNRIGEDDFAAALSEVYDTESFQYVSWDDWFSHFSRQHGESLEYMKKQWVDGAGAPSLAVENVTQRKTSDGWMLEFTLRQQQNTEAFRLDVPVEVQFEREKPLKTVLRDVAGRLYHARIPLPDRAQTVAIDPGFDVFRVVDPREAPATLAGFFAEEKPVVILGGKGAQREAYRTFAEALMARSDAEMIEPDAFHASDFSGRSVLFLREGDTVGLAAEAMESGSIEGGRAVAAAFRDPDHPEVVHLEIAGSAEALMPLVRKLPHYGKYSYLAFDGGENIGKGWWPLESSPLQVNLP